MWSLQGEQMYAETPAENTCDTVLFLLLLVRE